MLYLDPALNTEEKGIKLLFFKLRTMLSHGINRVELKIVLFRHKASFQCIQEKAGEAENGTS